MRLLDLYCGAGGCSEGYRRAGFTDITGVDIEPQPQYPFRFIRGDAVEYVRAHGEGYDAIHASPPCQAYTSFGNLNEAKFGGRIEHPELIEPTRTAIVKHGLPYVIENVIGAPLRNPCLLCGTMFGLRVQRHRVFETSFSLVAPKACSHSRGEIGVYGPLDGRRIWTRKDGSIYRVAATLPEARAAMGIDWMTWDALTQAIPPQYTEYIGRELLRWIATLKRTRNPYPRG